MKRRFAVILISCLLAVPLRAEPRKLGFSGPLSGGGAAWGNDVKNVLQFASEKLAPGKYRFVIEDDLCQPKTAISAAEKLSHVDKIREVFVVCGPAVLASARSYKQEGVTVMAPLATPARISELEIFRTGLSDRFAARKLAEYIAARHTRVHILTEENDFPVEFAKEFEQYAHDLIKLEVINETFASNQQDFRTQLLRLKTQKVEALFLNTQTEQVLAALVKQLHELRITPVLYGAYLPGSSLFLKAVGKGADGISFVDFPGAAELLTDEGTTLYAEYEKRFGPMQSWSFAFPATFESFRAMHEAIQSGEPVDVYLHKTTFNGIFGRYSFDAHGDVVGPEHVLRIIRGGKAVPLGK